MKVAIVLLCAFGWCSNVIASPVSLYNLTAIEQWSNKSSNQALHDFMENFRRVMPCGIPEYDIPILAPIQIDWYYVDFEVVEAAMRGWLNNIFVGGADTFILQEATMTPLGMRVRIHFYWPMLQIRSFYTDFAGRLNQECIVLGNGRGDALTYDVTFRGDFFFRMSGLHVQLSRIQAVLDIPRVQSASTGWVGTPQHSEWCQQEFDRTVPQIIRNNQAGVNKLLNDIIVPLANKQLRHLSFGDLMKIINDGGNSLPPCNP